MNVKTAAASIFACTLISFGGCTVSSEPVGGWQKIGGPLRNVSGMALVSHEPPTPQRPRHNTSHFLVVHDNKSPTEPRVGLVTVDGPLPFPVVYSPLRWRHQDLPADLEAVCPVPRTPGSFLAMTSAGRLLHLRLSDGGVDVLHDSVLPGLKKTPNLEGFAVQSLGGQTVAAWAERGDGDEPGVLYFGTYDPVADAVTLAGRGKVTVPFPATPDTRHVSDLRIDETGAVWATAASDPGDRGPFRSALYELGTLRAADGRVTFEPNGNLAPRWTTNRKIEALELLPGEQGLVYFGADDEAAGGWVYIGRR